MSQLEGIIKLCLESRYTSTIALVKNPMFNKNTKHIKIVTTLFENVLQKMKCVLNTLVELNERLIS